MFIKIIIAKFESICESGVNYTFNNPDNDSFCGEPILTGDEIVYRSNWKFKKTRWSLQKASNQTQHLDCAIVEEEAEFKKITDLILKYAPETPAEEVELLNHIHIAEFISDRRIGLYVNRNWNGPTETLAVNGPKRLGVPRREIKSGPSQHKGHLLEAYRAGTMTSKEVITTIHSK